MQMSEPDLHSALEVGQRPDPPQLYSTLESRQPDLSLFDSYKQSTTPSSQSEIYHVPPEPPGDTESDPRTACTGNDQSPRKRRRWIFIALGTIIIIATTAIGGIVGGTRHHSISSASLSNQANSPTKANVISSSSSSPSSSSSIVSSVSSPAILTASSFPTPTAKLDTTMLNTTNLASIIFTLNGLTQYRVWYQAEDNMIREVGRNDTGVQWYSSGQSHGPAKKGSSIAASYTGPPDWPLVGALTHRALYELIQWSLRLTGD